MKQYNIELPLINDTLLCLGGRKKGLIAEQQTELICYLIC